MNIRLTWLLTIHGFLYATYGFTLQKQLEQAKHIGDSAGKGFLCFVFGQTEIFLFMIASVGITISVLGFRSIRAAQKSSHAAYYVFSNNELFTRETHDFIESDTRIRHKQKYLVGSNDVVLPDIRGGGVEDYTEQGQEASYAIPVVLALSWIISILMTFDTWINSSSCIRG